MFYANPNDLTPPPSSNFPSDYRPMASITMRDFVLGSTNPLFYGFVAQSLRDPSQYVLAFRGTSDWIEWWDDAHALGLTPFRVPGCGSVAEGFAQIYDTIEIVEYPAGAPTVAVQEFRQRSARDAESLRRRRHRQTQRLEALLAQDFAGVRRVEHFHDK